MIKIDFTPGETEALFNEKSDSPDPLVRKKAEVLYLKSLGFPHTDIQDIARVTRTTLASYLKSYLEGGMAWVLANNHHGRVSELDGHAEMMKKYFAENPPASSREAVARVRELTGLSRSPTQVRAFMGRLGMKFRKAGFVPGGQKNQEKEGEREGFQKKSSARWSVRPKRAK
jgi:transposase